MPLCLEASQCYELFSQKILSENQGDSSPPAGFYPALIDKSRGGPGVTFLIIQFGDKAKAITVGPHLASPYLNGQHVFVRLNENQNVALEIRVDPSKKSLVNTRELKEKKEAPLIVHEDHLYYGMVFEIKESGYVIRFQGGRFIQLGLIPKEEGQSHNLQVGDYVSVHRYRKVNYPGANARHRDVEGSPLVFVENFRHSLPRSIDTFLARKDAGLELKYSRKVLMHAQELLMTYSKGLILPKGFRDYRDKAFFTVDNRETTDRDDALSIEALPNGNFKVHIAVPHLAYFFKPTSRLGRHMMEYSTSHYQGKDVWHLLPPELVTKLLSIDPNKERLAMVNEFIIDGQTGAVLKHEIQNAMVKSRRAYDYYEVQDMFQDKIRATREIQLFQQVDLLLARINPDPISLINTPDKNITYDPATGHASVQHSNSVYSQKAIARFMTLENIWVAKYAHQHKIENFVYRNLSRKSVEETQEFFLKLESEGVPISWDPRVDVDIQLRELDRIFASTTEWNHLLPFIYKYVGRAEYSYELEGHFAFYSQPYAHMTSPLRRSPDYWNQYLLYMDSLGRIDKVYSPMSRIGYIFITNDNIRNQKIADRNYKTRLLLRKARNHVGQTFEGHLAFVSDHKIEAYVPGLDIYVSDFRYPNKMELEPRVGATMSVILESVDLISGMAYGTVSLAP